VGDILTQPELLRKNYDVITAFRFRLNVEPEIRRRVLRRLREVIREPHGRLVVNVHGNSRSLRHPAIMWRRWRERSHQTGAMLNEMSPGEVRMMLRECGFQVVRQFGFGMLPPTRYRTPLRNFAFVVDQTLAGDGWCNDWAVDMLFVCRRFEGREYVRLNPCSRMCCQPSRHCLPASNRAVSRCAFHGGWCAEKNARFSCCLKSPAAFRTVLNFTPHTVPWPGSGVRWPL